MTTVRLTRNGPDSETKFDADHLVIDVYSTICGVRGNRRTGAGYGLTKVLENHPTLAARADTGKVLHARLRTGSANTARSNKRFLEELIAGARRPGATGEIVVRFNSDPCSNDAIERRHRNPWAVERPLHDGGAS
jgi:hypothetical protein